MLKVFYVILLVAFIFCSFVFRDLNQQEVLVNYFFSEILIETSWLVVVSFLSGVLFSAIFIGVEIIKIRRRLKMQIRSEKKIRKQLAQLEQGTTVDHDTRGL